MRALAASVRGVDALGVTGHVYHYPGPYGLPWLSLDNMAGVALTATRHELYVLDEAGHLWTISVQGGRRSRIDLSEDWKIRGMAASAQGLVYINADGAIHRYARNRLNRIDHPGQAALFAVRGPQEFFIVSEQNELTHVQDGASVLIEGPPKVISLAANERDLVVASEGYAFRRRLETWERLPRPITHRPNQALERGVVEVSLSERTLWARDDGGFVHMLAEG